MQHTETEAMRLVSEQISVPVPKVLSKGFNPGREYIEMTLIPGFPPNESRDGLDEKAKESICHQTWDLISKIRDINPPSELQGLFQYLADGSPSRDKLLEDLQEPARPLISDSELRARIYERYLHFGGRRYLDQLPDMRLRSSSSVFTHADIAHRNIMIDDYHKITGILDWEWAGWYPDYWEYAQIPRSAFGRWGTSRFGWKRQRRRNGTSVGSMLRVGCCFDNDIIIMYEKEKEKEKEKWVIGN
jgi:hypothetical protein